MQSATLKVTALVQNQDLPGVTCSDTELLSNSEVIDQSLVVQIIGCLSAEQWLTFSTEKADDLLL